MTSYLSSLLTNTTSTYTSLKRSILSDENDGDTEDESHVSRALRAYYVEKGRQFPPWLPPDPREAKRAAAQQAAMGQQYGQGGYNNPYQQNRPSFQSSVSTQSSSRRGGGLSDLWDSPGGLQAQQPASLRRGASGSSQASGRSNFHGGASGTLIPQQEGMLGPRPGMNERQSTTSLRVGRNSGIEDGGAPAGAGLQAGGGVGGSAQDRLKQRLWGKGRGGG